jgi:cellulose biosynthesis protein BcsQ
MKTIAFFNNKGGVGKTTLVYHFSYMMAELGHKVLCIDLDPQSNLTSMFLSEERLEEVFSQESERPTIFKSLKPLIKGIGDVTPAHIENINDSIGLLIGDLELSTFEDKLSENWGKCLDGDEAAFRVVSSFYRIIAEAGNRFNADFAIVDVGPNLGAMNRVSIISSNYIVMPVAADLFSLQGIKNLGSSLKNWEKGWKERLSKNPEPTLNLPQGEVKPIGYVVMQHGAKESRPIKSYLRWANRIPNAYNSSILGKEIPPEVTVENDPGCIMLLKHYHSLMPMAMEAHKPIFLLKPADGAIGAHYQAVKKVYEDFKQLAEQIRSRCD